MKSSLVKQTITHIETISQEAEQVRAALIAAGLENPLTTNTLSNDEKKKAIAQSISTIMDTLGLDRNDDSLAETPARIAKMYVEEIFSGLNYQTFPKISIIENKMQVDEMITVSDINLTSTCEHHFVTIDGYAKVAYIPKQHIIGLSKINRLVQFFAQRPQVQERLTRQVLIALQSLLKTDDVAILIEATHYCVKARGIKDGSSKTRTSAFGGCFKKRKYKREFLG